MKLPTTIREAKRAARKLGFEHNHDADIVKDVFYVVKVTHFAQRMVAGL